MKIMTYNILHCMNYVSRKIDFEGIARVIRESGAEIVCLNEVRGKGVSPEYEDQTSILSSLTGLKYSCFAKAIDVKDGGPYGNALLSAYPIISAKTVPIPDPEPREYNGFYETRCILKAVIEGGLTVMVSHFGLNPDEQRNAVKTVVANLESERCIFTGDLNVTPDSEVLLPLRAKLTDAAQVFAEPLLSFPSDAPKMKIDYILSTPDLQPVSADIPAIVVSDHRPHVATFDL